MELIYQLPDSNKLKLDCWLGWTPLSSPDPQECPLQLDLTFWPLALKNAPMVGPHFLAPGPQEYYCLQECPNPAF